MRARVRHKNRRRTCRQSPADRLALCMVPPFASLQDGGITRDVSKSKPPSSKGHLDFFMPSSQGKLSQPMPTHLSVSSLVDEGDALIVIHAPAAEEQRIVRVSGCLSPRENRQRRDFSVALPHAPTGAGYARAGTTAFPRSSTASCSILATLIHAWRAFPSRRSASPLVRRTC